MIAGLTPPPKDDRKVFAVKYKALQGRFDPKTYLYRQHTTDKAFPCASLGSLTVTEPDYGSGSRAVERTSDDQPKYIRITDFRDDGIPAGHELLTAETIEPECFLQDGDVLFARSGATADDPVKRNGDSFVRLISYRFRLSQCDRAFWNNNSLGVRNINVMVNHHLDRAQLFSR